MGGGQPQAEGPAGSAGAWRPRRSHLLKTKGQRADSLHPASPLHGQSGRVRGTSPHRAEAARTGSSGREKQKQATDFRKGTRRFSTRFPSETGGLGVGGWGPGRGRAHMRNSPPPQFQSRMHWLKTSQFRGQRARTELSPSLLPFYR